MARLFDDPSTEYGHHTSQVIANVPITIALWFYCDATPAFIVADVGTEGTSNHGQKMVVNVVATNNVVQAQTRSTSTTTTSSSGNFGLNAWHHAATVFAASNDRRAYLDGGNKGTGTTDTSVNNSDSLHVGTRADHSFGFSGRIADAGFWDVALTDNEIAALARGMSPMRVRPGNLQAYYPLYGSASPEPDYSGTNASLTLVNTPAQADHAPVMPPFGFDSGWQGAFTAAAGGATIPIFHHHYQTLRTA